MADDVFARLADQLQRIDNRFAAGVPLDPKIIYPEIDSRLYLLGSRYAHGDIADAAAGVFAVAYWLRGLALESGFDCFRQAAVTLIRFAEASADAVDPLGAAEHPWDSL